MAKQLKIYEKELMSGQQTTKKDFLKYTSKPTHITHKIFRKIYAVIYEIKLVFKA